MLDSKANFICLITGPAGAGKSSVSRILAKKFKRSAHVDVDKIRNMIVGGYIRPWPHNTEVESQLSLSIKNACDISSNFLEERFNVFIDDVVGEIGLKQYSKFFLNNNFKAFVLLPSLESLLKRFDQREKNEELRKRTHDLHKSFLKNKDKLNWQVIDSSN